MSDSVRLNLIGIVYNQIESGVYALIMEDTEKHRRLAIVIGYPEAQSIECKLQNVKTPRPLTHDLLAALLDNLNAKLVRVDIHRLSSGPYAGILSVMSSDGDMHFIDARSSDAVALAIRVGAPIFTSRQLLEKEGYSPHDKKKAETEKTGVNKPEVHHENSFSRYSLKQLHDLLVKLVGEEKYEEAAKVKAEIESREGKDEQS